MNEEQNKREKRQSSKSNESLKVCLMILTTHPYDGWRNIAIGQPSVNG
jgi:hypothetical protein